MSKSFKATRIDLLSFSAPHMRTFHITWIAFFLCFFGWFGIAPLMAIVREELALTKEQIGNTIIASVAITIFARLFIGWLCDKIGPRLAYTGLLVFGSIPVMLIGLSNSFESFLIFRLMIGVIGASFVITQYHTSVMFAPSVVGTANATTAGWGNLGGGVTQMIMPLIFAGFLSVGFTNAIAWRYSMVVTGVALLVMAFVYYRFTQDTPEGNFSDLVRIDKTRGNKKQSVPVREVLKDSRVWCLFLVYGACFGVELTINNIAAMYYVDNFTLDIKTAGLIAGLFGLMNLFARSLGGFFGDRFGVKFGLRGRVSFLFAVLLLEGFLLILFSQMTLLPAAIITMVLFSLFVQMSEGATFSVVPFVNSKAIGTVSGIVGAGGNVGAVAAGFLFRSDSFSWQQGLFVLGITVVIFSFSALGVRFPVAEVPVAVKAGEEIQKEEELVPNPIVVPVK